MIRDDDYRAAVREAEIIVFECYIRQRLAVLIRRRMHW